METNHSETSTGIEPPPARSLNPLKQFKSAGRGFWSDVSDADWNDWRWQLKHRITTAEQLQKFLHTLTPEEFDEYKLRTSPAADIRSQLAGFAATDEELRAEVLYVNGVA